MTLRSVESGIEREPLEKSDLRTTFENLKKAVEDAKTQVSGGIYDNLIDSLIKLENELMKEELLTDTGQEQMVDKN